MVFGIVAAETILKTVRTVTYLKAIIGADS